MYADVLVEYSAKMVDQTFTYIIPLALASKLKRGMKVLVPFGSKVINGFVVNISNNKGYDNLKEIISITDENFCLNDELLSLGKYLKNYCFCSLISIYQAMLPASMKVKSVKSNYDKYDEYLVLENGYNDYILKHKSAKKQIELLTRLIDGEIILKKEYPYALVKILLDEGVIGIKRVLAYRLNAESKDVSYELNSEQNVAFQRVISSLGTSDVFLLYGVTGSGKTVVYMKIIDEVISKGKSAIMLVPEISLTTQIIKRFYDYFGDKVAIFHSGLSIGEKSDEYHKILDGKVKVVVGTRSAIFVPIKDLGVIIIDEEHSTNYKQDTNPRYNAKSVALWRGAYNKCPVVMGSATPSLEMMARAKKEVVKMLTLKKRALTDEVPNISIVNMQDEYKKGNSVISDELYLEMQRALDNHKQVILFLNRRGFNTFITCKNCGFTYKCPNCDITLTYHKSSNNLRCHYCGHTVFNSGVCPSCGSDALTSLGLGTERLEEEVKEKFSGARVIRMDADTTTRKGSFDEMITLIEEKRADIIIGTQMVSKGLDFPDVTVVGVINADESLNVPDFRSGEYTFSLLSQVGGRAGRSSSSGKVIFQSFNPDNETLKFAKDNDYEGLYNYEMNIRRVLKYPPYYYLTIIKFASKEYELSRDEAKKAYEYLNKKLNSVIILGPTTARMFKVKNVYRFQIILKYKSYEMVKDSLTELFEIYKTNSKVNIEIDNNPLYI